MKTTTANDTFYYVKYARVSTDEQKEGISLDFQLKQIDAWVSRQSETWICVGTFEEDFTGFEYERPEMSIIWELAKQGKINAIVVLRRNRFSRGEVAGIMLEQHFKNHKVRLFSTEQGEFTPGKTNRIVSAVERAQAEESAEEIKKNMREKRYAYIANGAHPSQGPAFYGYNKIGKKAQARYVINEDEAEIIRFIFDLYIRRYAFEEIAIELNNQNIPQPSSRMTRDGSRQMKHKHAKRGWTRWVVRHIIYLADSYKGMHTIYKHTVREDAPNESVIDIPAIIDHETYVKATYLREQTRHVFNRISDKPNRPFPYVGRFTCKCGYSFSASKVQRKSKKDGSILGYDFYYRCNSTLNKKHRGICEVGNIKADKVETVLWNFISEILIEPKAAIARYQRQQKDIQRYVDTAIAHLESIDEVLSELHAEKEQVITLFKKRLIDEDRLDADIAVIQRQVDKLQVERNKWAGIIQENTITDSQIRELERIATTIREELDTIDSDTKHAILDMLRIKVTASKEDGIISLYVSILGAVPERLELTDSGSSNTWTVARKYTTTTTALTFRIPLNQSP